MRQIIKFVFLVTMATAAADDAGNTINRTGRTVQIDGFLVEWKRADAKTWENTGWEWDAIITPRGIAGYFRAKETPACSAWTFDISPKVEIIVTDQENHIAEWLISDVNTKRITATATSNCGEILPTLVLTVNPPETSTTKTSTILYTVMAMAMMAALTVALVIKRRKNV